MSSMTYNSNTDGVSHFEFCLKGNPFIPLNALLKMINIAESGGQANHFITQGEAKVNGVVEMAKRKKIRVNDRVAIFDQTITVIA